MIKLTIATDKKGNVIGAVQHGTEREYKGGGGAGVDFGPGCKVHTVEVGPEYDMTRCKDINDYQKSLKRCLPKAK